MDQRTRDALEASIAKWQRNASITDLADAKIRARDCPLCELFNNHGDVNENEECDGCPVKARTDQEGCVGTPYHEARRALTLYHDLDAFRDAAALEVKFLESLREPEGEA